MNSMKCLVVDAEVASGGIDTLLKQKYPQLSVSKATSVGDALEFATKCIGNEGRPTLILCTVSPGEGGADAQPLVEPVLPVKLTDRQRQLIDLLLTGMSNRAIADTLNLSYGTVKNYIFDLMRLISVGSRLELVARVRQSSYRSRL